MGLKNQQPKEENDMLKQMASVIKKATIEGGRMVNKQWGAYAGQELSKNKNGDPMRIYNRINKQLDKMEKSE